MRILSLFFLICPFISSAQKIYTFAGNGNSGYNGDSIYATKAAFNMPSGSVAVDAAGNVFIADTYNQRIRKVSASDGKVYTVAGTGIGGYNGDGIPATDAKLYNPSGIAIDNIGNLYISDYANNRIRKVTASTGLISTIAGTGVYGYSGDSILATTSKLTETTAICVDAAGNVYFTDAGNSRIRKIEVSTGLIRNVAGNGTQGYNGDNQSAKSASLNMPWGLCLDPNGNLIIGDKENHRVRMVNMSNGIITTIAGNGTIGYNGDTIPATSAIVYSPWAVASDAAGNIFIADSWTNRIRMVNLGGTIFTVAGNGQGAYSGDGGLATSAQLNSPRGIFVDGCNNLYISEYYSNRYRKVESYNFNVTTTLPACYGTCNGNISTTASGGNSPYLFSYPNITPPAPNSFCAGDYFLKVTDNNGCSQMRTVILTQPSALAATTSTVNASCNTNGSATVSVNGGTSPYTYSWSSGHATPTATGLSAGIYTSTITDNNGCTTTKTVTVNNASINYASAPICMVTVDSASQYNVIAWDKTQYTNIDSFIIYREIGTNDYRRIGVVEYDSLSEFVDTVRTLYFPNSGNPNAGTYRYKIKMIDTCGRYSQLSPYHNTIFIINNNGTFSWTQPYTIEGGSNPVNSYVLMRDNFSNGNWNAVNSVAGTQQTITDPAYAAFASTASWRVETFWGITCNPTRTYTTSRSNKFNNLLIGVPEKANSTISIYPSVTDGLFTIEGQGLKNAIVEIYSSTGQLVSRSLLNSEKEQVSLTEVENGMYFIKVIKENSNEIKRIVLSK